MKAFLAAVVVAAITATAASFILASQQETAAQAFTTAGARVGDPGHNLIGVN